MRYTTRITVMFFAMAMFILSSSHDFHSHDSLVEEHYEVQCDLCQVGELDDVETSAPISTYTLPDGVVAHRAIPFISTHKSLFHSRAPPVKKV